MPLSKAAAASGPGGTTSGDPEGDPAKVDEIFDMVMLSVITLPQVGHMT